MIYYTHFHGIHPSFGRIPGLSCSQKRQGLWRARFSRGVQNLYKNGIITQFKSSQKELPTTFVTKKTPRNWVCSKKSEAMPKTQTKMTHPHIGMSPNFAGSQNFGDVTRSPDCFRPMTSRRCGFRACRGGSQPKTGIPPRDWRQKR